VPVQKTVRTPVFVHYMPWFETPATNQGRWGIHWTMANRDPDTIVDVATGRREIAAHAYPLIGPYASSDPDVLEYQVLLMKFAGIDGVLVDWYGTSSHADYPLIGRNVEALLARLPAAGLQFAFVYEDQSVRHALQAGVIVDGVAQARADLRFMASFFGSPHYVRLGAGGVASAGSAAGRPLLMTFGPQHFQTPGEWSTILAESPEPLALLTLWYESGEAGSAAAGEYAWIYQDARPYSAHLADFYARPLADGTRMGVAFPGFQDFYREGGWGDTLFHIDHRDTATLQESLTTALAAGGPVQLATWNDYGEGTMLEPTVEFGHRPLQVVQHTLGVDVPAHAFDLVQKLHRLRKRHAGDAVAQAQLDVAFGLLASLRFADAALALAAWEP